MAKTVVVRHCKERLRKCTLRGVEDHPALSLFTFRDNEVLVSRERPLPDLDGFVFLTLGAPSLTKNDDPRGLLVLDGTWRLTKHMERCILPRLAPVSPLVPRSMPSKMKTAYPRNQTECPDPVRGLATIEAIYAAHLLLGWDTEGLLDHYFFARAFLDLNSDLF